MKAIIYHCQILRSCTYQDRCMTFHKGYDLEIVSITVLVEPSITETVCEYWLATYMLPLPESKTTAVGCKPTGTSFITVLVEPSITETVPDATYMLPLAGSNATPSGDQPTAMFFITVLVEPSITETV